MAKIKANTLDGFEYEFEANAVEQFYPVDGGTEIKIDGQKVGLSVSFSEFLCVWNVAAKSAFPDQKAE